MRPLTVTAALALGALLFACGHNPESVAVQSPIPTPDLAPIADETPPPRAAEDQPREAPVAEFSIGRQVHRADYVDRQWQAYREAAEEAGMEPLGKSDYRELLIDELLLLRAAERDPSTDDPIFQARLEMQRRRLMTDQFIKQTLWGDIEVTPADIQQAYDASRARWTEPAQARVRQIQFPTLEAALEAQRRLQEGETFDAVAEEAGVQPADLGWIGPGQLDQRLEDIAFGLEIGQVSGVISTGAGHFLLLKVGSIPQRVIPLAEVEDDIRSELLQQRRRDAVRGFLERERAREGIPGEPVLTP